MGQRRVVMLGLSFALMAAVGAGPSAADAPQPDGNATVATGAFDPEHDCLQIPPESVPSPLADGGQRLPVEVRVLVAAEDLAIAKRHMAVTQALFDRIGIELRVSFDPVRELPKFGGAGGLSGRLLDYAKARYRGQRPAGTDAVYFMTRAWDGGFADCIGGVADPRRAFAIGSVDYAIEGVVPAPTVDEGNIAGHELGHLFGAHHHYSNCAEAQPYAALRGEPGLCTLMSPLATAFTGSVSTVERLFIRHYAKQYARG